MTKLRGIVKLEGGEVVIYGKGKKYEIARKPRFLLKPKMDVMFDVKGGAAINIGQIPRFPGHRPRKYE